ncbi:MAG: ABC transporter permease subunit [Clostridiales bacterium]|nr:ABC transporter permease subunit [Clostridiales bacterium]
MRSNNVRPRVHALLERAGVFAFYIALWALAARWVNSPLLLPTPLAVLHRLGALLPSSGFWLTLGATLLRTLLAYLLGIAFAVLLAALCCRFRAAELLFSPLLSAVRATPVTSFIVLALVWLSSARVPVLTGFLMTLPVVYSALTQAVRAIDPRLLEMARLYRFGRGGTLRRVVLPSVLPAFVESCLAAIGLCWKAVVAAEVIGVPKLAVGSRLYEAKIYLETDSLLAWTLMLVLLSVLLEALLRRLTRRFSEVRHD